MSTKGVRRDLCSLFDVTHTGSDEKIGRRSHLYFNLLSLHLERMMKHQVYLRDDDNDDSDFPQDSRLIQIL